MKSLSDLLHKTPWWALLLVGVASLVALAAYVTPYSIIEYRQEGATPEERRAIKRVVDNTFADNAIEIARNVLLGLRRQTTDPDRRRELDDALQGLDEARSELREAGAEVLRSKREALQVTRDAARAARDAIREAQREARQAVAEGGAQSPAVAEALEQSLRSAEQAEREAARSLSESRERRGISIGAGSDKPMIDIEVNGRKIVIPKPPKPPTVAGVPLEPGAGAAAPSAPPPDKVASAAQPPAPPPVPSVDALPPELRDQIRRNVTSDMYRIGIGAALGLILIPMFILAVIAKFFIDRSRAATRLAELKRKEAEYARMAQQVTEAKLQALQAQVEPHFLYNTLASVQALTEVDPARASEMTGHLIHYLRNALPKMREGVSTVGQEIELVRAYLSILQMRMGKRLAFDIAVPASLNAQPFPPLMLPSLVENAIKHGLEPQREGGSVMISARLDSGKLCLVVADTGRGFGEAIGAGVGLANIRERLAALYGDAARLTLEENSPRGVIATIEVPADGARAASGAGVGGTVAGAAAQPAAAAASEAPRTRTAKTLAVVAGAERAWRKGLTFTFMALVIVAAVLAGLGIVGVTTHAFPVHMGDEIIVGPGGALVGTAGILLAFLVVVIAIAIVVAVLYGLGFLVVGIAIFVCVMIVVSMAPVLAPIVLAGLAIWWILRRKKRDAQKAAAQRVEPAMAATAPTSPQPPPPVPPADRPL